MDNGGVRAYSYHCNLKMTYLITFFCYRQFFFASISLIVELQLEFGSVAKKSTLEILIAKFKTMLVKNVLSPSAI